MLKPNVAKTDTLKHNHIVMKKKSIGCRHVSRKYIDIFNTLVT